MPIIKENKFSARMNESQADEIKIKLDIIDLFNYIQKNIKELEFIIADLYKYPTLRQQVLKYKEDIPYFFGLIKDIIALVNKGREDILDLMDKKLGEFKNYVRSLQKIFSSLPNVSPDRQIMKEKSFKEISHWLDHVDMKIKELKKAKSKPF